MSVAVISSTGKRLMPTTERRARQLLKKKRAVIYRYNPYQPGNIVTFNGALFVVKGTHCHGPNVMLSDGKSVAVSKLVPHRKAGGYARKPE